LGEAVLQRRFDPGREVLKWVAVVTMTIDHIGAILYPDVDILRIIGRIAFPIYCYLLLLGVGSTRNVKNYLVRLLVFAFISQVPYYVAHGYAPLESLDIYFTLFFGALSLLNPLLLVVSLVASFFLSFDYGPYGIGLIVAMQLLKDNQKWGVIMIVVLNVLFYFASARQVYSLLALPLILAHKNGWLKIKWKTSESSSYPAWRKYFFYSYYPLHLAVLVLIRFYLTGSW
jgi:hypothetical protein